MIDFTRCRLQPFAHQREDAEALVAHPFYFVASEMRTGKTKIVIDAAQQLFLEGKVDRVIVIAPAAVKDVWADPVLGELAKHLWHGLPATVTEFHSRTHSWLWEPGNGARRMEWIVTNFEFVRAEHRRKELQPMCGPKTLLVIDESTFVANWDSAQTEACMKLRWGDFRDTKTPKEKRRGCGRVVLLNGTPIDRDPLNLFSQGNLLHPSILDCRYVSHFKGRYAVEEPVLRAGGEKLTYVGKGGKELDVMSVAGWSNLEDLRERFKPYAVRRLQADCADMPAKLDPVTVGVRLSAVEWKAYKEMRDEMVAWLEGGRATAQTAAIKSMRLSQITSGFVGGVEEDDAAGPPEADPAFLDFGPEWIGEAPDPSAKFVNEGESGMVPLWPHVGLAGVDLAELGPLVRTADVAAVREVGRAKLDGTLEWVARRLSDMPDFKFAAWCKFKPELMRLSRELMTKFPSLRVGAIHGRQKRADRLAALALLKPETAPRGAACVAGTFGTGSYGLDFRAARASIALSHNVSPGKFLQSVDRTYGPGQDWPHARFEVVASGPRGQRTIDHHFAAALRERQSVADWTVGHWVLALKEE